MAMFNPRGRVQALKIDFVKPPQQTNSYPPLNQRGGTKNRQDADYSDGDDDDQPRQQQQWPEFTEKPRTVTTVAPGVSAPSRLLNPVVHDPYFEYLKSLQEEKRKRDAQRRLMKELQEEERMQKQERAEAEYRLEQARALEERLEAVREADVRREAEAEAKEERLKEKALAEELKMKKLLADQEKEAKARVASESKRRTEPEQELSNATITDDEMLRISKPLSENDKMVSLNLSRNKITVQGMRAIAKVLTACGRTLQDVNLSANNLGPEGGQMLARCIGNLEEILYLDVSETAIGDEGFTQMCQENVFYNLEVIKAADIGLTDLSMHKFAKNVSMYRPRTKNFLRRVGQAITGKKTQTGQTVVANNNAPPLAGLDFSRARLSEVGVETLCFCLPSFANLAILHLNYVPIATPPAYYAVQHMLEHHPSLIELSLVSCHLEDLAIDVISKLENTTLRSLDISSNRLGINGGHVVEKLLGQFKALEHLNIGGNHLQDAGSIPVGRGMEKHRTLTSVDMSNNTMGKHGARALCEAMKRNKIAHVNLYNNVIGDEGAGYIAVACRMSVYVRTCNLSGNEIGLTGAHHLATVLINTRAVELMDMSLNKFGPEGEAMLHNVSMKNSSVRFIF
eukprot:GFYU01024069.1.p1 GENE.GFYU01024069.1~~GFYU01024069.1.p1  ORF type:complete len:626 (-),score=168.64 GFYU01024069.1:396-2273(-)